MKTAITVKQTPKNPTRMIPLNSVETDNFLQEETDIKTRLAEIEQAKKDAEARKEQARLAKIQQAKDDITSLKADCKIFRQKAIEAKIAKNDSDEKLYKDSLIDAEQQIKDIETAYSLDNEIVIQEPEEKKIKFLGISTTRAVALISSLILVVGYFFWKLCIDEVSINPANDGVLRMLNTSGYRLVLNALLWAMSILTGIGFIYFFMPDLWRWLHNRIISDVSLKTDFEQCTPYQRLTFFTLNFWLPAFLFALCLLVIMG